MGALSVEYPVTVALARAAGTLPAGPGWWYEPKLDGDRAVVWRRDTVRVQTRSGRDATAAWIDVATAAMDLPADTVLDGEAVIWRNGKTDFGAVRSRASARGRRLADLIHRYPASYVAFDCLMLRGRDLRGRPYTERRAALLDVLEPLGPPLQTVPATDNIEVARVWFEVLPEQGIEGIVAKQASGTYRPDRSWRKVRTAETVDAAVVGYTGPATRPKQIAVQLPDGRRVLSQTLTAPLSAEVSRYVAVAGPGKRADTAGGEPYTAIDAAGIVVEVAAGTTRHAVVTVTRIR
ncbi:ATP-dependent DNA ligase [Streptomyces sp. NPDC046465]|uniref:ATP-dependent DNA ligase n=1 Tax=Streptomyces sp. NPDC046465 TaxID=3155810 RepID=UPI0033C3F454